MLSAAVHAAPGPRLEWMLAPYFIAALLQPAALAASTEKPSIFFLMADDLGSFDVGFRNPLIKSPNLDRLVAEESLLLLRHYAYFVCSPTRRSFLSGRLPSHLGTDNHGDVHIDPRMHTVADKLAAAGYATGTAGKW